MQVTVEIPDDIALRLTSVGQEPSRATIEALAIEGYRSGALNTSETRRLLGFATGYELDGFLKAHKVWEHAYGVDDLEEDRRTLQALQDEGQPGR